MFSIGNVGSRLVTSTVDHFNVAKSKTIISSLINQCKTAIRYFKMKNARKVPKMVELQNIASDYKEDDLAALYAEHIERQKVYNGETLQERRRRGVSISRRQENAIHLLQLLKEKLSRKRAVKERELNIIDSDTRELMQWLEELPTPVIEGKNPAFVSQQGHLASYADDICIFEMVVMLYEWGESEIVNLMSEMMKSSDNEMVANFGNMFNFLSDILAFLPDMVDQMVELFKQERSEMTAVKDGN